MKRQIAKALEASEPSAPDTPAATPRVVANAKYYVAISTIANQTTRPDDEIAQVVGGAVRGKLDELGGYQIAPQSETPDQARASMSKRKLKGYYLAVRVEKFDYSDGNLRVRVKVAVFTYPGKDLRGEVPSGLTQTGVSPGDKSAEDNLLRMAAGARRRALRPEFPMKDAHNVAIVPHPGARWGVRVWSMTTSNFPTTSTGRYKRSFRNLLIDSRFQLKYTGLLVIVAIIVSVLLGGFLYATSREVVAEGAKVVEESKKVSDVVMMNIKDNYGAGPRARVGVQGGGVEVGPEDRRARKVARESSSRRCWRPLSGRSRCSCRSSACAGSGSRTRSPARFTR